MTKDVHEDMTLKHEHILCGVEGQKGLTKKVEELWDWFLNSRGKNTVVMFVKDLLISGGVIAVLVSYWILG